MPILDWLGKDEALKTAQKVPYRLLEPVPELSNEGAEAVGNSNLLIQGDNLEALKALLPFYAGQVRCIFIDPPYNTGSAFEHYDDNLEHSTWLSLMYPRLELLRELLCKDGSIWVTIDDNEAHYLKVIMDEVFGRSCFLASIAWRSADSSNNDSKQFSLDHNHTLVFSRHSGWRSIPLARTEESNAHYSNPDDDPRGPWFSGNLSSPNPRPNLRYLVKSPNGTMIQPPRNGWRWSEGRMMEMISRAEVIFNRSGNGIIKKTYLEDQKGLAPSTIWDDIEKTGHNRQAKYELKKLFPDVATSELFATPKPERLLKQILEVATNPGELVLDSFLGSGTTAAVAHKMGRRYIGIEMGEHAVTHCAPRLEQVIGGEQGGISEAVGWKGGGGFRFLRLGEPLFDPTGLINPNVKFAHLASFVWFSETRMPLSVNPSSPLLGIHEGVATYLLFNGILGDRRPAGGNVLTTKVLEALPPHDGPKVIFGEASRIGSDRLRALGITFKQTPFDLKAR